MKKIQEHLGLVFLIIIAIFAVAIGGYFTLRKGVFIGDDFYYKVRADKFVHNTVNYVERTKDDTFLLVADGKKQNVSYTMKGDQVTFSFADDTINGTWTGDQLLAADGSPVGWDEMQIIAGNEKPVISDETYSNALGHILYGNLESISFCDLRYWESLFMCLESYRFIIRIRYTFFCADGSFRMRNYRMKEEL